MKVFGVKSPGADFEEMTVEAPELTGRSVLLKVTHSGVCHSDVHMAEGFFDLGGGANLALTDLGAELPFVLGHEVVGEILATGPDSSLRADGQKYVVFPWIGCDNCQACAEGRENYCTGGPRNISIALHGGHAEEIWIPDEKYIVPIGDLDPSWAATLACSGVTSYSAVEKVFSTEETDRPIAVIGVGGVGLNAVAILSVLGHKNIVAADVSEAALENAKAQGATSTVLTTGEDPTADLIAAGGGQFMGVIDFVNNTPTSTLGLSVLAMGGKLVPVGLFGGSITYPAPMIALLQLRIEGNYVGSLPQLKTLIEIAKKGDLPKLPIEERPLSVEAVNTAIDDLANRKVAGRVVMVAS